ncbi:uncharacterized protein [Clytia hemisphaerica]|uniref:EGF-like domain-containing protein n=1 Tax=Clytia hemisphaerica TaxID=252671 RepID=A0A7M5U618_9CNID|eukprot:TCONS_00029273-protein
MIMGNKTFVLLYLVFPILISCQVFQYFIVNNKDQTAKVIDTVKLPTCTHLDQEKNVTLKGGINAGKFTKHGIVPTMDACINACCQDAECDVAFMPGQTCYRVNCYNESLCQSVPANPTNLASGEVRISHIIRGGGAGDDVDEFRKKNGVNRNSNPGDAQCTFSRVEYGKNIAGGKHAGEVIDLGPLVDIYDCAKKCCQHDNCEVAHIRENKCYAVDCFTRDLCRKVSVDNLNPKQNAIVYMNKRSGKRQRHKDSCGDECGNGLCSRNGTCSCDVGFKGDSCDQEVETGHCDPVCGEHGYCMKNDSCKCDDGWQGYKCQHQIECSPPCANGLCLQSHTNQCRCEIGWTGLSCNESTSDKLVLASSGEEVLFTDSEVEPELDIKIHQSPRVRESESISTLAVAIGCGVAAALLGTAAIVYIGKQVFGGRSIVNYEYLAQAEEKPIAHDESHDSAEESHVYNNKSRDYHDKSHEFYDRSREHQERPRDQRREHHEQSARDTRRKSRDRHHRNHHRKYP